VVCGRPSRANQLGGEQKSRQTEDVLRGVETGRVANVREMVFHRVVDEDRPRDEVFVA